MALPTETVIFLPVVERELRVAARKRSTFWTRISGALVALLIGSGFLLLTAVGFGFGTVGLGKGLFSALSWLCLAWALSAGLFFTSDCLSEEKREGTLGFLFLTDLRGHDVVLGKLLATSLRGFYALLAVFPILAVTLLMGGVTGAQFWKTSLALINALFVSLTAGLCVSTISRDSQKALAATLLLLLLLVAAGPVCDVIVAVTGSSTFEPGFSLSSPGYVFVTAGAWGRSPFWAGLLVNQLIGWLLFGLACCLLPRTWQEKARSSTANSDWGIGWKLGGTKARTALRRRLVSANPTLWLVCRERWQGIALWPFTLLMAGCVAATAWVADSAPMSWLVWSYFGSAFVLMLYLWVAFQAGRFFVDAKRSGLFELLLATPLTARQIVQGQWRGMARMFALPLALCLAAQLYGAFQVQHQTWSLLATAIPPTPPPPAVAATPTNTVIVQRTGIVTRTWTGNVAVSGPGGSAAAGYFAALGISGATTVTILANLVALVWVGMWMGLNSKNANLSTLKTIVFVQVIPWFVISFVSALAVPLLMLPSIFRGNTTAPSQITLWFPFLSSGIATVLYLIKDAAFSIWARRKLYSEFRECASRLGLPGAPVLPPPLPRSDLPPALGGKSPESGDPSRTLND